MGITELSVSHMLIRQGQRKIEDRKVRSKGLFPRSSAEFEYREMA